MRFNGHAIALLRVRGGGRHETRGVGRPSESVCAWIASSTGCSSAAVSIEELRPGGPPWLLRFNDGGTITGCVLKTGTRGQQAELATEAAALALAEKHGLPTPRLIAADLTGEQAGQLALLFTALEGDAQIPADRRPSRLRRLGAAAAEIHSVSLTATDDLPVRERHMPWIDLSTMRREAKASAEPVVEADPETRSLTESTPLLDSADALLAQISPPQGQTVFVHGDLWHGNTMWLEDSYVGTIDWEAAGVGSYGVDLGSLRLDAALHYGLEAADDVLAGWQDAAGRVAHDLGYWDLVAGLNTTADMGGFLPTTHQAGRTDLDAPTLVTRRDDFVRSAMDRLA